MKTQKIMGWHRYQILADDNTPACIIEMTPAITDEEKEAILEVVRKLTMRAVDSAPAFTNGATALNATSPKIEVRHISPSR